MTDIAVVRRRVEDAGSLAAVLDAAYDAFEETMAAIRGYEDRAGSSFAAIAFAAAAAADGRDAVASAPSLPRPPLRDTKAGTGPADVAPEIEELGAALAALARMLGARLAEVSVVAPLAEDRAACRTAARQAREICRLLSWGGP
jgi:hypothetical protein